MSGSTDEGKGELRPLYDITRTPDTAEVSRGEVVTYTAKREGKTANEGDGTWESLTKGLRELLARSPDSRKPTLRIETSRLVAGEGYDVIYSPNNPLDGVCIPGTVRHFEIRSEKPAPPPGGTQRVTVTMARVAGTPPADAALWVLIRTSTDGLAVSQFAAEYHNHKQSGNPMAEYQNLRTLLDNHMLANCGVLLGGKKPMMLNNKTPVGLESEDELFSSEKPEDLWKKYTHDEVYKKTWEALKKDEPVLIELIYCYWLEEGMLCQSVNAVSARFQNRRVGLRDPLVNLTTDPLRPLSNLLWGYIQDEQHRLTVQRRAYEYDHQYGLRLEGRAVAGLIPADSRSSFLESFHNLLNTCTTFYDQDADTTVHADGFPVLSALKDVHLVLRQGMQNQYGDLTWTARRELMLQKYVMAQDEMRQFLPSRPSVAYPETWMAQVDTMKKLQGWTDVSVLHFYDLARFGEKLLLSIRFGNWTDVTDREVAAAWARHWQSEVLGYIHAYRTATGVDLATKADAMMPSVLLRRRLEEQRRAG